MTHKFAVTAGRTVALGTGLLAGACAASAGLTWLRFGRHPRTPGRHDQLLDRFMPVYDVVEQHFVRVAAPADIALAAACDADLMRSPIVRAIFRTRERALGTSRAEHVHPRGLLSLTQSIGWRVLAERAGEEVLLGAVTRPWDADVVFRPIAPEAFAAFEEPGYVKIAWTLRVHPIGRRESVVRTETRAVATDAAARAKFRRYWSIFSPGIVVIRRLLLRQVKRDAERLVRAA